MGESKDMEIPNVEKQELRGNDKAFGPGLVENRASNRDADFSHTRKFTNVSDAAQKFLE